MFPRITLRPTVAAFPAFPDSGTRVLTAVFHTPNQGTRTAARGAGQLENREWHLGRVGEASTYSTTVEYQ